MTEKEFLELKYDLEKMKVIPQKPTILDIINKVYDENIVSNWLSFIFNPKINGIGNAPIEALLTAVGYEADLDNEEFVEVKREEATTNKKRMDLVIKYKNIWIVIENKIRSYEHDNQTVEYFNYIEKQRKEHNIENVVYVYLRPDWNEPNNPRIPKKKYEGEGKNQNGFRNLFYSKLMNELKEINYYKFKDKEKFKYINDFIEIGERYYMGEEFKINEELRLYIKHRDDINELQKQYDKLNKSILSKLVEMIENKFQSYDINDRSNAYYIQISKKEWNKNEKVYNAIHYELLSDTFPGLLGCANAKIAFYIHLESGVSSEKREKIYERIKNKDLDIERKSYKLWIKLYEDTYSFTNENDIEDSLEKIIKKMKEIDDNWGEEIDSWKEIDG